MLARTAANACSIERLTLSKAVGKIRMVSSQVSKLELSVQILDLTRVVITHSILVAAYGQIMSGASF